MRKQTQKRINDAFKLQNGINTQTGIHSPTFKNDFGHTDSITQNFQDAKNARERKVMDNYRHEKRKEPFEGFNPANGHLMNSAKSRRIRPNRKFPHSNFGCEADYARTANHQV